MSKMGVEKSAIKEPGLPACNPLLFESAQQNTQQHPRLAPQKLRGLGQIPLPFLASVFLPEK